MTEREENNRILAAWVGWQYGICRDPDGQQCCGVDGSKHWHSPFTTDDWCPCGGNHGSGTNLPDFYTDEAASGLLRDKGNMRIEPTWVGFGDYRRNGWQAMPMDENGPRYVLTGFGLTAMEAVANAALLIARPA